TGLVGATSFIVGYRKSHLESIKENLNQQRVTNIDERTSELKFLPNRTLTDEQIQIIRNALSNTNKVSVLAIRSNSKESQQYSRQFEDLFSEVGWEVEHFLPMSSIREVSNPKMGLNSKIENLEEFDKLKQALEDAELPFQFDQFESDTIKQQIIFDVGIIPANDYQTILDKIN
ncbi:unnamed protein product, partial [marine sediment metagenome]